MTRRRWIADEYSHDRAALTGAHAAHLSRTLRARVGQQFEIACGETVRLGKVTAVADGRVEFALGEEVQAAAVVPITLLLAVFKFDRMEWAIEKCTELNVTTIVPVIARRTEKHLAHAAEKRVERWRRIAREASEQSRRASPPEIATPMKLNAAIAQLGRDDQISPNSKLAVGPQNSVIPTEGFSPTGEPALGPPKGTCCSPEVKLSIVLAETEWELRLSDILREHESAQSLTLAVGPEGGWTPDELQAFATSQFISCSLGGTILRAETAVVAALAIARGEI